jgi:hypothetical protein
MKSARVAAHLPHDASPSCGAFFLLAYTNDRTGTQHHCHNLSCEKKRMVCKCPVYGLRNRHLATRMYWVRVLRKLRQGAILGPGLVEAPLESVFPRPRRVAGKEGQHAVALLRQRLVADKVAPKVGVTGTWSKRVVALVVERRIVAPRICR